MGAIDLPIDDSIDRCVQIELEMSMIERPHLSATSTEDLDDEHQAMLGYVEYVDSLQDEYNTLRGRLGLEQKSL